MNPLCKFGLTSRFHVSFRVDPFSLQLKVLENARCKVVCNAIELTADQSTLLEKRIKQDYTIHMYVLVVVAPTFSSLYLKPYAVFLCFFFSTYISYALI